LRGLEDAKQVAGIPEERSGSAKDRLTILTTDVLRRGGHHEKGGKENGAGGQEFGHGVSRSLSLWGCRDRTQGVAGIFLLSIFSLEGGNDYHTTVVVTYEAGGTGQTPTMSTENALSTLPVSTLKVLAKMTADAVKSRREDLGQTKATFEVDQTVVIRATGTVKVSKSSPDAIIAQAAKPWAILVAAIEEANRRLAAAGAVGINLEQVVEIAETANPDLAKDAEKKAKAHLKAIKETVRGFKWGGVAVAGEVTVIAKEDHRPEFTAVTVVPEIAVPF